MRLLVAVFLLTLLPTLGRGAISAAAEVAWLDGERLDYDISFLWFDRLATGFLSVEPEGRPETWRVELSAHTLGIAAWLTRDREQSYVSIMQRSKDGVMRVLEHSSNLFKGRGGEREGRVKRYLFDYSRKEVEILVERPGEPVKRDTMELAGEVPPNDILTTYINLRLGHLGPLTPGRVIVVPTFSRKGNRDMQIEILPEAEWPKAGFFPSGGLLCKVTVDQEVFNTGGGHVYVWFAPGGKPRRGIVEQVLGMGDVRGVPRYEGEGERE